VRPLRLVHDRGGCAVNGLPAGCCGAAIFFAKGLAPTTIHRQSLLLFWMVKQRQKRKPQGHEPIHSDMILA